MEKFYHLDQLRVAEDLNGKQLQSLEIAVLYSKIPDEIKEIISPYISVENDEARLSVRIRLIRVFKNELIKRLNNEIETELNLNKEEFRLTGVLIF